MTGSQTLAPAPQPPTWYRTPHDGTVHAYARLLSACERRWWHEGLQLVGPREAVDPAEACAACLREVQA